MTPPPTSDLRLSQASDQTHPARSALAPLEPLTMTYGTRSPLPGAVVGSRLARPIADRIAGRIADEGPRRPGPQNGGSQPPEKVKNQKKKEEKKKKGLGPGGFICRGETQAKYTQNPSSAQTRQPQNAPRIMRLALSHALCQLHVSLLHRVVLALCQHRQWTPNTPMPSGHGKKRASLFLVCRV